MGWRQLLGSYLAHAFEASATGIKEVQTRGDVRKEIPAEKTT